MNLDNTFAALDEPFGQRIEPSPVSEPVLLLWNQALADQLGLSEALESDPGTLAEYFSGNRLLSGSEPIAMAYAGHQFGHFVPQLGDGRAHLLGELLDGDGRRWDIQLKGSGRTRFSRGGDGRCALGPALREFLMSEALYALGVPTTRCLAVVASGDPVIRESALPGAVVTRVASSHLRVGSFQYLAARGDNESLARLVDYAIRRHDPDLPEADRELAFFERIMDRQIDLVVQWLRVGFIHGVMNTDNTAISGETIDFGPCAMLGVYDPATVYSSIDHQGRYAFGNQPAIAQWNLARLAECLLPLVDADPEAAADRLAAVLQTFPERFKSRYFAMMGAKLGLAELAPDDTAMIDELLAVLRERKLDYTLTFRQLTDGLEQPERLPDLPESWLERWRQRAAAGAGGAAAAVERMRAANPLVIPRNHQVEQVLAQTIESGDPGAANAFLDVLRSPYQELPATSAYQEPPADGDRAYQTFCGT